MLAWVSKTDVIDYRYCDQGFWLARYLEVEPDDAQQELIDRGTEFDTLARKALARQHPERSRAIPLLPRLLRVIESTLAILPTGPFARFLPSTLVFNTHTVRHPDLRLIGIPDGYNAAFGLMEPMEIKNRQSIRSSDLVELAFYWQLLSQTRTARHARPAGWIINRLPDGSPAPPRRVTIPQSAFDELDELIAGVRAILANEDTPELRWCNQASCRCATVPSVRAIAPLYAVLDVGGRTAGKLSLAGLSNATDLANANPVAVRADLEAARAEIQAAFLAADLGLHHTLSRDYGDRELVDLERRLRTIPSTTRIEWFRANARRFIDGIAEVINPAPTSPPRHYLVLDLEYELPGFVWSAATAVVHDGLVSEPEVIFVGPRDQAELVNKLSATLRAHPDLPVMTWAGTSADLPRIRRLLTELDDPRTVAFDLDDLERRHFDGRKWLRTTAAFPNGLGLKAVARHFGITPDAAGMNGFAAAMMMARHHTSPPAVQQQIETDLRRYAASDVMLTAAVTERLRDFIQTGSHF